MLPITHLNYSNCVNLLYATMKCPLFLMDKWLGGARKNLIINIPTHWNQFQDNFTFK